MWSSSPTLYPNSSVIVPDRPFSNLHKAGVQLLLVSTWKTKDLVLKVQYDTKRLLQSSASRKEGGSVAILRILFLEKGK